MRVVFFLVDAILILAVAGIVYLVYQAGKRSKKGGDKKNG